MKLTSGELDWQTGRTRGYHLESFVQRMDGKPLADPCKDTFQRLRPDAGLGPSPYVL